MSLLPNQSYANPDTPLWADAGDLQQLRSSLVPTRLIPVTAISVSPIANIPSSSNIPLTAYPTVANSWYDIDVQMRISLNSGTSSPQDSLEFTMNVGGVVGVMTATQQIGAVNDTDCVFRARIQAFPTGSGAMTANIYVDPGPGSTAVYSAVIQAINVTEITP